MSYSKGNLPLAKSNNVKSSFPASGSGSGSWKTTLLRNLSRVPISCALSAPPGHIVKPQDTHDERRFVKPPRSEQYSPHATVPLIPPTATNSSIPSPTSSHRTQEFLKSLWDRTYNEAVAIHESSVNSAYTTVKKLKSENASLQKKLLRLQLERDLARQRIQMLSGKVLPATVADAMLKQTIVEKTGTKRKRDDRMEENSKIIRSSLSPPPEIALRDSHSHLSRFSKSKGLSKQHTSLPLDDINVMFLQYPPTEEVQADATIKRRRTSAESIETAYSSTSTFVDAPHSASPPPPLISPPCSRSSSCSTSNDFLEIKVKVEEDERWTEQRYAHEESVQDMDLASECSDS